MVLQTTVFTRERSVFWLRINENDDGGYNFYVSINVLPVFRYHFSEINEASPNGWINGNNYTKNIWVPRNCTGQIDVDKIMRWAQFAGNQCLWFKPSKHLTPHFDGSEINHCIAADFNFATDDAGNISGTRTDIGNAEFQLKYHPGELMKSQKNMYYAQLSKALCKMIVLLPTQTICTRASNQSATLPIVSPIPAQSDSGLAWKLAKHVANQRGLQFIKPRLESKPQMKNSSIEEKLKQWNSIYANSDSVHIDSHTIKGSSVIIIDDLYQSGVTMWAYAKFLTEIGASQVYGLACVKSMKDTDNQ